MRQRIIVVGTDMELPGDDATAEGLRQQAEASHTVLHVVHVLPPGKVLDVPGLPGLLQDEQARVYGPPALERRIQFVATLHELPHTPARIRAHVVLGQPIDALIQATVDHEADVLIVGMHARRGLQGLLMGSVAEQLLARACCPVLIARPRRYRGLAVTVPGDEHGH